VGIFTHHGKHVNLKLGIVEGARDSATGKFITDIFTPIGPEEK